MIPTKTIAYPISFVKCGDKQINITGLIDVSTPHARQNQCKEYEGPVQCYPNPVQSNRKEEHNFKTFLILFSIFYTQHGCNTRIHHVYISYITTPQAAIVLCCVTPFKNYLAEILHSLEESIFKPYEVFLRIGTICTILITNA